MKRKAVLVAVGAVGLLSVTVAIAWPTITFFMLTGHFSPIHKIESLNTPVAVKNWSADGLHLANGRVIQLPGFRELPETSAALAEIQKHGVEIDSRGQVYGLVRVVHWCGNDPVREHIARVDVADMLTFLREGERIAVSQSLGNQLARKPGGSFRASGWEIGEFTSFQLALVQ